jgi:hypothetical protein
MRVASGLCIAGCYTVIEAWLQAKVTNETRGRAMGVYRMVDTGASLAAQLLIGVLAPASYVSYNLLAILCCAALLPLTLTRAAPPETRPRRACGPRPRLARISPLAVAGVIVAGVSGAAFRMVGPLYGTQVGLADRPDRALPRGLVVGGALAQWPAGWLADRLRPTPVLIWFSVASIAACAVTVGSSGDGHRRGLGSPRSSSGSPPSRSIRSPPPMPMTGPRTTSAWNSAPRSCSSTRSAPSSRRSSPPASSRPTGPARCSGSSPTAHTRALGLRPVGGCARRPTGSGSRGALCLDPAHLVPFWGAGPGRD